MALHNNILYQYSAEDIDQLKKGVDFLLKEIDEHWSFTKLYAFFMFSMFRQLAYRQNIFEKL